MFPYFGDRTHSVRSLLRSLGTRATGAAAGQRMSQLSWAYWWEDRNSVAPSPCNWLFFFNFSDRCFLFDPVTRIMQTTCPESSTPRCTLTSYSWLIWLLACKLVRAGTMFGLCIGLSPCLLPFWPSRSSVNICEIVNPQPEELLHPLRPQASCRAVLMSAMYMQCLLFMSCSCSSFQPVSS